MRNAKNSDFHTVIKYCEQCNKVLTLNNTRDINRKRFCSRHCSNVLTTKIKWENNPEQFENLKKSTSGPNKKKGHRGNKHPQWIEDRSKVKQKRSISEERWFFSEVLQDRKYTCELTGTIGGKLSVHHINSVHLFPELQFDKQNVVVIQQSIHKDFHKKYGYQWATKEKWKAYLEEHFAK